jgi:hypothetical protein
VVCSPLIYLADICGYFFGEVIQTVDKAILLLKRKADISCRDHNGNTVLHTLLECPRPYEDSRLLPEDRFYLSLTEPKQLLMAFITAGADVYAINNRGETPSMIAWDFGREDEWTEALTLCGYDSEEVFAQSDPALHDCTRIPQSSKLSFEEFCQVRQEHLRYKEICFGEYCQGCGEKFRHEIISFEERCPHCGKNFQAKEVSFEGHYQAWRERYLLEKASFTRYYQELRASLPPEEEETTDTGDESDEDGYNYISDSYEGSENVEIGGRPTERDTETMLWNGWDGENFRGGGYDDNDINIGLKEAEGNWKDDSMKDVGDQGMEDGDSEGDGFERSNLNTYSSIADDMAIFKEFCDFSNYSDAS